MTLFEYLAIAFSLVFSYSGLRLIGGLPSATRSPQRYWVHLCFVFFQLTVTLSAFWGFWNFRDVEWTFLSFAFALMSPPTIYYGACVIVPENPAEIESWHDYYFSVRKTYFVGLCCWLVVLIGLSTVILDMPLADPLRAIQAIFLSAVTLGLVSANERVHGVLAVFLLAFVVILVSSMGLQPGALAAR